MKKIYLLNDLKFEGVENLEVFEIKFIKKHIDFSKYNALVFTSKNAVYSLNQFNNDWKKIPSYAITDKTGEIVTSNGGNLVFCGINGHGNEFAYELVNILKDKKVLYLKALNTVSNIFTILKENEIYVDQVVVYENICKESKKNLQKNSIFIFTSPSSINCFFKNYDWDDSYKAVVIGDTTAKYMPENINFDISPKTSVEECIKLAFSL